MKQHLIFILTCIVSSIALYASDKPEGAMQIIGPKGTTLISEKTGGKLDWPFEEGVLTVKLKKGHAITAIPLASFKAHIEFCVNEKKGNPGNNGNSGIYIQQRYELQILNSFGRDKEYSNTDCGSIYKTKKPDAIVCLPAGEWQSYDIEFHAAQWEEDKKTSNARITVIHNGTMIHDNFEIPNKTGHGAEEGPGKRPLRLQNHGNDVKFRNFWLLEI